MPLVSKKRFPSLPTLALWLGAGGVLIGYLLMMLFPQRPDGDLSAIALFEATYQPVWWHQIQETFVFHLVGALLAWGLLDRMLQHLVACQTLFILPRNKRLKIIVPLLFWAATLLIWSGWAWNQSRGWDGYFYLEPDTPALLGPDQEPTIQFERFLLPPAASGIGRTLSLRLLVNNTPHDISVAQPYHDASWRLTPDWYGVIVSSDELTTPLYFGLSESQQGTLQNGASVLVTVNIESVEVTSMPALAEVAITHYAILAASFMPGRGIQYVGGIVLMMSVLGYVRVWLGRKTMRLAPLRETGIILAI